MNSHLVQQYNYTIIIPHKNIPELLQRCLDSVPTRDDVQIIIVDDNSNPEIVDFDKFPGQDRDNVKVIFTKEGKGAGYARNVGLKQAKGKWLVFADADDFFSKSINELLDDYINHAADIIFFDNDSVMSDNISIKSLRDNLRWKFERYEKTKDEWIFRTGIPTAWGKLIKRKFIIDNDIKFDESHWSNDIMFAMISGAKAKSVAIDNRIMYVVTQRQGSLSIGLRIGYTPSSKELSQRMLKALKASKWLREHNFKDTYKSYFYYSGKFRQFHKKYYVLFFIIILICYPHQAKELFLDWWGKR